MELDKFITQTLLDIRNGVRGANEEIARLEGGELGKDRSAHFVMGPYSDESGRISFDIAVTVQDSSKSDVGASIHVLSLASGSLASKLGFRSKNERISRIKFCVKPDKHTG